MSRLKQSIKASILISTRWGDKREGRGFSMGEIQQVGLTLFEARSHDIPIDPKRRTVHPWNITALRRFMHKIPLTEIKGIGNQSSKKLQSIGIQSVQDLASYDIDMLPDSIGYSKQTLIKWQTAARQLVEQMT